MNSSDPPSSTNIALYYNGNVVSDSNMLPVGKTASGSVLVGNVTASSDYKMTISITLQNRGPELETLDILARS